ncbi:MAG: hypothetical protein OEZ08_01880 [Betaproteobacteria bacterium]|nr:hypothetical protein [Betaproteobacteria bacterium]
MKRVMRWYDFGSGRDWALPDKPVIDPRLKVKHGQKSGRTR